MWGFMDPLNTNTQTEQPNIPDTGAQPGDLQISPSGQIISPSNQSATSAPNAQKSVTPDFLNVTESNPGVTAQSPTTPNPTQPQSNLFMPDNPQNQINGGSFAAPQQPGYSKKTNLLSKLRSKKYFLPGAIVAGLLLLAGTATAAYLIIGSNTPEKSLAKAVKKTMQQENITAKGSITITEMRDKNALKYEFEAQQNSKEKKASLANIFELNGQKFNIDTKIVDSSLYIKLGDINKLMKMFGLDLTNPALKNYASAINVLNKSVGDQWIKIDEKIIKQVNKNCSLDSFFVVLSKEDQELIFKQYKENGFAKIKSSKKDSVNGKAATHYSIDIDSDKINKYAGSLDGLSIFNKLQECQGRSSISPKNIKNKAKEITDEVDNIKNEYDIWVDKATGMISKLQIKDKTEEGQEAIWQVNLDYGKTNISAPENAKSFEAVIDEISQIPEISELIKNFSNLGGNSSVSARAEDTERKTDIKAIHGQLEAYMAQNGKYPTLTELRNLMTVPGEDLI